MQGILRCLKIKDQKMRTQILMLTFAILILTIFLVSIIVYINNLLVLPKFTESSEIMYFKSAKKNLQSNLCRYKSIILKTLEINGLELIALNKLYNEANKMVRSMDPIILNEEMNMYYGGLQILPEILWDKNGYGGYNTTNSFLCYSNLSQLAYPLTYDQQVGIKIQEYFQTFGQMMYIGDLTKQSFIYGYTISDTINFIYPCLNRREKILTYVVNTRNWYVDALYLYNSQNLTEYTYLLTKPYILFTEKKMGLTMYSPMINLQKQFIGAVGTNILSSEFSSFFQGTNTISMIMLVDEEGVLIVHNYTVNFSDLPLMIFNQNLTGFNQEDWDYIIKKEGQTQCVDFQSNEDLICVHNTFFNQDVLIEVTFLEQYKLHLIIFQDTTELRQFQNSQQNKIQQFFTDYLIQVMSYAIYLFLFCAVFIIFMIILIMGPIHKITKSIYKKMNKNEWGLEKVNSFQEVIFSQTLLDFYNSYFEFVTKISGVLPKKKSEICIKIENIQYPHKIYRFHNYIMDRRMKFLQNRENIPEVCQKNHQNFNNQSNNRQFLKIIINALKQVIEKKKL